MKFTRLCQSACVFWESVFRSLCGHPDEDASARFFNVNFSLYARIRCELAAGELLGFVPVGNRIIKLLLLVIHYEWAWSTACAQQLILTVCMAVSGFDAHIFNFCQ